MPETPFVHVHNHTDYTDYSLLDRACKIEQLMKVCAEQNMAAVGMTDHGNLFGAVSFYNSARAATSTRKATATSSTSSPPLTSKASITSPTSIKASSPSTPKALSASRPASTADTSTPQN